MYCSSVVSFTVSPRTLFMPTQSLPVGDTTSPTALCSESHMNTQHTVTGECGHYCCTSEAMAVKAACTTNHPVVLHLLGAIVTGVPLVVGPLLMVQTSMLLQEKVEICMPCDIVRPLCAQ